MATNFVTLLHQVVQTHLDNQQQADLVYGTYTVNGLKIDNKPVPIPLDMVDIPERLRKLADEEVLNDGDRVAILQKYGGQRYFILDRL